MKETLFYADVHPEKVMDILKVKEARVHDRLKISSEACVHFEKI